MALADSEENRRRGDRTIRRRRAIASLAIAALLAISIFGWAWSVRRVDPLLPTGRSVSPAGPARAYALFVGEKVCGECHPAEAASQSRSGHAKTLRPPDQGLWESLFDGRMTVDPERPGVSWKFTRHDGRVEVERTGDGSVEKFVIDYAFGSGRHATTFVSMIDRDPLRPTCREHRLSYFAHSRSAGLTPGQSLEGHAAGNSENGRVHGAADTLNCFFCHSTVTSDRGPESLDPLTMIPNVTCERCHGPARSHVESARRGDDREALRMPNGPGHSTTDDQLELCGRCHRLPAMISPARSGRTIPVLSGFSRSA